MTPAREAIVLPVIFLTVTLLGGLHLAATVTALQPPPVFTLILAVLLVRLLVQSGTLAPGRLLSSSRSGLANANGFAIVATLWLASAQTLALLVPSSGLPRIAFNVFFAVLLLNTAAAAPDRRRLLQSLAVTFGAAFVLKFVVLQELSSPGAGTLKRVLQAMLDTVTLGVLVQEVLHPAAGYLALFTIVLFLIGLILLPAFEVAAGGDPGRGRLPPLDDRPRTQQLRPPIVKSANLG